LEKDLKDAIKEIKKLQEERDLGKQTTP